MRNCCLCHRGSLAANNELDSHGKSAWSIFQEGMSRLFGFSTKRPQARRLHISSEIDEKTRADASQATWSLRPGLLNFFRRPQQSSRDKITSVGDVAARRPGLVGFLAGEGNNLIRIRRKGNRQPAADAGAAVATDINRTEKPTNEMETQKKQEDGSSETHPVVVEVGASGTNDQDSNTSQSTTGEEIPKTGVASKEDEESLSLNGTSM